MIWTLKKLVARRSARKASAPESKPAPDDSVAEDTAAAAERAAAVESAEQAADAEAADAEAAASPADADSVPAADSAALAAADTDKEPDAKPEAAKPESARPETAEPEPAGPEAAKPAKRRRAPKLDALLAADVETARTAVLEVAPQVQVGEHAGARAEDDRVVTHLFESDVRGYKGWQWFAVLARVPRGKTATVSEVGLLPSERSLLSPEWIPWAERVRPEEKQQAEAEQSGDDAGRDGDSGGA